MIEVKVKGPRDPRALAELIASTVYGQPRDAQLATAGSLVQAHKELADGDLPAANELPTVNFSKLDDDSDWTDV